MRLHIEFGHLDDNHHGPKKGRWTGERLTTTWQLVELGCDSFLIVEGRTLVGWRLWVYGPSGSCWSFDIAVKFDRCPYRTGKFAARPDYVPPQGGML